MKYLYALLIIASIVITGKIVDAIFKPEEHNRPKGYYESLWYCAVIGWLLADVMSL